MKRKHRSHWHRGMRNAYALNLLKAGYEVHIYDINPNSYQNLIEQGAIVENHVVER